MGVTTVVGRQGRLVIPVELRKALDLHTGDEVYLAVEAGQLIVEKQADAAAALRGSLAARHPERSLVDELLAERRTEAAQD